MPWRRGLVAVRRVARREVKLTRVRPSAAQASFSSAWKAGVEAAAEVDDGADAPALPGAQLVRPGLVAAHQLIGDPVRVLEAEPQIGVVAPQVVEVGAKPPAPRRQVEISHVDLAACGPAVL